MSRIGKKPVAATSGVTLSVDKQTVKAKGPKGEHPAARLLPQTQNVSDCTARNWFAGQNPRPHKIKLVGRTDYVDQ